LPTIFGTALASDLKAFIASQHGCTLLQYVDDILLAAPNQKDCIEGMHLLSLLCEAGYKVSWKKDPDLPKHCQIPWLLPVPRAMQAQS
jgi:hypothetical protein